MAVLYPTFLLLLLPTTLVIGKPAGQRNPEIFGAYFQGDMELTNEQSFNLFNPFAAKDGIRSEKYRWPDKTVKYKISKSFGNLKRIKRN